jgi:hypothetical protein
MGDSSDIDALIKDMNSDSLSNEENSMVNSILNDLNGPGQGQGGGQGGQGGQGQGQGQGQGPPPKITSQQNMPQITEEEKEMLIKQQMQQQQIAQQRIQQQMAQQRMMQEQQMMQQQHQQQHQQQKPQNKQEDKPENTMDMVKNIFFEYKDVVIVLFLSILFNLEIISENLKIKNVSFLYDMEKGKETILSTIMKGFIIAVIYLVLKLIIK